jgi:hypothetical protein
MVIARSGCKSQKTRKIGSNRSRGLVKTHGINKKQKYVPTEEDIELIKKMANW